MKIDVSFVTLPKDFNQVSDFFIPEDNFKFGIMYPGPKQIISDQSYYEIINIILKHCREEQDRRKTTEFSLELIHEGKRIILRGHSIHSIEGKIFILRRLPSYIPRIEDLGMPPNIIELLTSDRMNNGGLILIAGETGQGKSTTAASSIAYRLKHYGSFCLTIEDPVEMPLQGFYENINDVNRRGICFQTSVDSDKVEESIKSALRCYPSVSNSILFLGETRDSIMASEVLKIAANGHLVFTTMHGGDLMVSLRRFINLAMSVPNANETEVKALFSSVFRLMIHQKLETLPNNRKRIRPQILYSTNPASSVASRLRTGQLELLATEIQNQNLQIMKGASLIQGKND